MSAARDQAQAERSVEIRRFVGWINANGGEVVTVSGDRVRYVSASGEGSLTLDRGGETYTGDARLAIACCRMGTTLSPFAIRPVEPPSVVQSLRARADHTATIIADASRDPGTGAAGWAAWMIADGMPSSIVGEPIAGPVPDIGEAELMALAGALRAAEAKGYVIRGAEVLLQSDSLWALSAIRAAVPTARDRRHATAGSAVGPLRRTALSGWSRDAAAEIRATVDRLSLTIAVRHVPGHRSGDGRQWVNRECDRIAKGHMRAALSTRPSDRPIRDGGTDGHQQSAEAGDR